MYNIKDLVQIEMLAREMASTAAYMQGMTVATGGKVSDWEIYQDHVDQLQKRFSDLHTVMIGEMEGRK